MTFSIALRNLRRNPWRTGLTVGGVAMAVAVVVWMAHLMGGMTHVMAQSVTAIELGDAQIHSADYVEERSLYNAFPMEAARLPAIRALPGVRGASARVVAYGLVGHEKHSQVARILGIDPDAERQVTRTADRVSDGRWLGPPPEPPAPREVVLGQTLAKQLKVKVGDELVVLLQAANGALGNDALKIVGLARTGNATLDRSAVWMHIADVQWLTATDGRAHEIAIATDRGADLAAVVAAVRATADPSAKLVARAWYDIVPELHQLLQMSQNSMWILYLVVYFVAALGILNTQRMNALERRREFGVLLAIGTTPARLARQVIAESVVVCGIGGVVGALAGTAISAYHAASGFDWRVFAPGVEGEFTYMGVTFDVMYFQLDVGDIVTPAVVVLLVGVLCGLWPGVSSARLHVARAIAGRS